VIASAPDAVRAPTTPVLVVAGVLFTDGCILVAQRGPHGPHPLKWEFPGGKVEPGEDSRTALARELREELGIETRVGTTLLETQHRYPGGPSVSIVFMEATAIDRPPANRVFADLRWVRIETLEGLDFLAADREFVVALTTGAVRPCETVQSPAPTARRP
jgi:8-oxo-dGTP diphosphatase